MQALPFVFSLLIAVGLTPLVLSRLSEAGLTRENYRGRALPVPLGLAIVPVALIALIPVMLLARLTDLDVYPDNLGFAIVFVPGIALLGLIDDVLSGAGRGWRGHGRDVMSGALSTGLLKAAGTLGLALLVASSLPGSDAEFLLAAAVLVLATNTFNLLDLRPGPLGQGVRPARHRADDRHDRTPRRSPGWASSSARCSSRASSTCARRRCSATPDRTRSARSPGSGSCSRSTPTAS